jgi:dCTP deaminase
MILSNSELHAALDSRRLIIEPEPSPRYPTEDGKCPYQTSSVDLCLGNEISYFKEGLPISVDLRKGGFANLFGPNSIVTTITEEQPFALKPGKLVLGKTLEKLTLSLLDNSAISLAARIEGKSSYARCGLLIHFTAPTIHAGWSGTITLELINFGPFDIMLYPGAAICQLIIEEVKGIPFTNLSQFQGQERPGGKM